MKTNKSWAIGTICGGICGVIAGAATGPLSIFVFIAAFGSAAVTSAAVVTAQRQKVFQFDSEPNNLPKFSHSNINYQKVGYVQAKRWSNPLTPEQETRCNELFGEGKAFVD